MENKRSEVWAPGQLWAGSDEKPALVKRTSLRIEVSNTGDRPVQIGSHFHFFEVNKALRFDRKAAYGMRLAIPAGTAVRFEPGQTISVELITLGGERIVHGLGGLTNGELDDDSIRRTAYERARNRGYKGIE